VFKVGLGVTAIVLLVATVISTTYHHVLGVVDDTNEPTRAAGNLSNHTNAAGNTRVTDYTDRQPETKQPGQLFSPEPGTAFDGARLYGNLLKSCVLIRTPNSLGSGVVVDAKQGIILTNFHVINSPDLANFRNQHAFQSYESYSKSLTSRSPRNLRELPSERFSVRMSSTAIFLIRVEANFDALLEVQDTAGNRLESANDAGGESHPSILFSPKQDLDYEVVVTSRDGKLGDFFLRIMRKDKNGVNLNANPRTIVVSFPVYQNNQLITAKEHYVAGLVRNTVPNGSVVAWDAAIDLAIVKVDRCPDATQGVVFSQKDVVPGQSVHSIGNPSASGVFWVYTSGAVRTASYKKNWVSADVFGSNQLQHQARVIETQSPTNPGDSGGPLVNEKGHLVALTQGFAKGANAVHFFIALPEIRDFLRNCGIRWREHE
jgi:S1-C subfamily serine protease